MSFFLEQKFAFQAHLVAVEILDSFVGHETFCHVLSFSQHLVLHLLRLHALCHTQFAWHSLRLCCIFCNFVFQKKMHQEKCPLQNGRSPFQHVQDASPS